MIKKIALILFFSGCSHVLIGSAGNATILPLDKASLKQMIRRVCAAKDTIFLENIFDAIADKMTRYVASMHASHQTPQDRSQRQKKSIEVNLDVIDAICKVYIGLANYLNTILFISHAESMQINEHADTSLRVFVPFFRNGGTFEQICDCMHQAIVEVSDAELSQLIYQTEKNNETVTVFIKFNTQIALNLRRKVEAAAFQAEQNRELQIRKNKAARDLMNLQESEDRAVLEAQALDFHTVKDRIEKTIFQQNRKKIAREEQQTLIKDQQVARTQIISERYQNYFGLLDDAVDSKRSVIGGEESAWRALFFKRFLNQAALAVICAQNQRHAKMVEQNRKHRAFSPIVFDEKQNRLEIISDQVRERLEYQNDFERKLFDAKATESFIAALAALPAYQTWQVGQFELLEGRARDQMEVDETMFYTLISMQRSVPPAVVVRRTHNPYATVMNFNATDDVEESVMSTQPIRAAVPIRTNNPYTMTAPMGWNVCRCKECLGTLGKCKPR